jgi:hypothetical protein
MVRKKNKNDPLVTAGTTRSASAAFGDDSDESVESPVRKKQNTTTSTSTSIPDKSAFGNGSSNARTRSSTNNDIQTSVNDLPIELNVDRIDGAVVIRNTVEEEGVLDLVPPTSTPPTKPTTVSTISNIKGAEKIVVEAESKIPGSQKTEYGALVETQSDDGSNVENRRVRKWRVGLGWVGISILINLYVFSVMIWSGLVLNESATYQLESLKCRERLHLAYQSMGLEGDFEDNMDEDNLEKIEEQQYYWQELEAQARYWRREAKKYQRDGEGFRKQCREDLRDLLSEIEPHKLDTIGLDHHS